MNNKPIVKHLTKIFESELQEFLSSAVLERLDTAQDLFRWNNEELRLAFDKYMDFVKQDIDGKTDIETNEYFQHIDGNLISYLNREYQYIIHSLPYFLWASHLLFDGTYSQLTYEAKEELRNHCCLNNAKKRKDFYISFFSRFFDEKVVDGGSHSFWNEWTRLYFLALYEKYFVVIANVRKDINILKRQKVPVMKIRKQIIEKYRFPEELWTDMVKQTRKDALSRKLASSQMQSSFDKKYIKEMGFADSYLIKVLRTARKEAEKHLKCGCKNYKNHKLIFLSWGNINAARCIHSLNKEELKDLKFDSYAKKQSPGMELYFV